jgi:kynurenine formamidase
MQLTLKLLNNSYQVNTDFSWNLAIPLAFNHQQPNHFAADKASCKAMQAGNFIGDTEQGGSCNVNELSLNPHCNGTHTETIAHICDFDAPLSKMLSEIDLPALIPSVLITITPKLASQTNDSYRPDFLTDDHIISRSALEQVLNHYEQEQYQALIIRTLPNELDKQSRHYNQDNQPPFFSREAILYLNELGVEHLLVDLPSIDRLKDDGLMTCHHLFWQVIEGAHQPSPNSLINKTITEMVYVDNQLSDGFYFINIQIPAFVNDAAPSRPVLYSAKNIKI